MAREAQREDESARQSVRLGRVALVVAWIAAGLVLVSLALAVSFQRGFQVDEVEHIKVAYDLRAGLVPYRDFWEGHHLLLHGLLAPVIDIDDPVASYGRARLVSLMLMLATVVFAAAIARRLGGNLAAVLAVALLLAHSTFVERGMEVRTDIGLALCTLIALWAELSCRPRMRRYLIEAAALSAAFLFTTKAVFVCFVFGLVWLFGARREGRLRYVLAPFALWCAPVAAMLAAFAILGNLDEYLRYNWAHAFGHVGGASGHGFTPWEYFQRELPRNRVFVLAAIVGVGHALGRLPALGVPRWGQLALAIGIGGLSLRAGEFPVVPLTLMVIALVAMHGPARSQSRAAKRLAFTGLLAAALTFTLWLNPFPFPYLHVTVLPVLAVVAAVWLASVPARWGWAACGERAFAFGLAVVVLAAVWSVPRIASKAQDSQSVQLASLAEIHRITEPDDAVFDLAGMYFRPDAYPVFTMTGVMLDRYRNEDAFPRMIPAFRAAPLVIYQANYRSRWLPEAERRFLAERFVRHAGNIFVPGRDLSGLAPGQTLVFEVLETRAFHFVGDGILEIDGRGFEAGELSAGEHRLSTPTGIRNGVVRMSTPGVPPDSLAEMRGLFGAADFD